MAGRRVYLEHIVGTAEIAKRLGLKSQLLVHDWRRRYPDFPLPVLHVSGAYLWLWPEVERWARRTGRLPRRQ